MVQRDGVYIGQPDAPLEAPIHGFLARLSVAAPPTLTFGYHSLPPKDGRPGQKLVGDDPVLLEKTSHVRLPSEKKMGQFFARTGLGAAQIRTMTRDEIATFVYVASQQEAGCAVEPRPARS